jgi:hypothetical protein
MPELTSPVGGTGPLTLLYMARLEKSFPTTQVARSFNKEAYHYLTRKIAKREDIRLENVESRKYYAKRFMARILHRWVPAPFSSAQRLTIALDAILC